MEHEYTYLDYAAATPLDPAALAAMTTYFSDRFYNPSSPYAPARDVRRDYGDAKDRIAHLFGARGDELVVTAGATESINLAFSSVGGHIVTSAIEHQAVLESAKQYDHTIVGVSAKGAVHADAIKQAIRDDTRLVSIALANNELGTIQPLRQIAEVIREQRAYRQAHGNMTPLYLHSDGSQGFGSLDIHVGRLGVDLLTLNAAKSYGPKQVGFLWASKHVRLAPQLFGGGQERGIRSGTENVAGVIGSMVAMEAASRRRANETTRLRELRNTLRDRLVAAFPDAMLSGDQKKQLPHFLHISFPNVDAERVLFMLEAEGILVATGSACAANKGTRSHVLEAIGLSPEVADGSIRITLGRSTDEQVIERAGERIIHAVETERARTRR